MGAQYKGSSMVQQVLNCREGSTDAGIIAHLTVFNRYIEIYPHQDAFPIKINVPDRLFVKHNSSNVKLSTSNSYWGNRRKYFEENRDPNGVFLKRLAFLDWFLSNYKQPIA